MKTTRPIFGILTIAATLLPAYSAITARGTELYLSYGVGEQWNIGGSNTFTGSLSVPQFNPALGVLNSIDVDFTGYYRSEFTVYSTTSQGTYGVAAFASLSLEGNGINLTTTGGWGGLTVILPNFPLGAGSAATTPADATYGALNGLIGNGSASFQIPMSQSVTIDNMSTPPAGVTYAFDYADLNATATLTYGYTPVPEPSPVSLLAVGLGLMMVGRKALRRECSSA
jgi:hypothetical protein